MTIQPLTGIVGGILLLSLITVESGGWFLVRVGTGGVPANALQKGFFRAGHAHAGVLLVLGLANLALLDRAGLPLWWHILAAALPPAAAILMPAGFFLSVLGREPQRPSRLLALVWTGGSALAIGLGFSGIGLIVAGVSAAG